MNKKSNIPKLRFEGFEGEWEVNKINNLTNVTSGGTPSTLKKEYWNGNIPWMNSGELNLKLVYDVENRITELGLNKSSTKFIPKKSILIGLAGQGKTRGTAAMNMIELCINQSIGAILPNKEKFISEFLYLNIDSRYDELRKLSTGDGGRGGLNLQILKSLEVSIPTLPEQQKIASFLSAVDEKIQQLSRKKELLEQYKKGVMQQLFSGKLRFKDENGNDYPDWEEKKLGDVAKITTGGTPNTLKKEYWGGNIRWMNSGELNLKIVKEVENRITEEGLKNSSTKMIPVKCILIGLAGQGKTRGTAAMNLVELCTNQSIASILPNYEKFIPEYLYQNIDQRYDELRGLSTGDGGRGGLNLQIIKSFKINLPSIPEQQKIANFLSSIDAKIENTNSELEKTQGFKKGLLQQLFV